MYKNVWKNQSKGIAWKLSTGEQSFLCVTRRLDLISVPVNLHEDFLTFSELWSVPELFTDGQLHAIIICPIFQNGRIKS